MSVFLQTRKDSAGDWTSLLALRLRRHFALKFVAITAFTWVFFIGYFSLLREPAYPLVVMPLLALDHMIPFQPVALFAYLSLWLYVGFAPGLQLTFVELLAYGAWIALLCITGLALFYFWPTAIPPLAFDAGGFPGFALLQGVDAAGNACPSMHVAVAIYSAIWLDRMLFESGAPRWLRVFNWTWFAAIAWSTLAIKQHVMLDAMAGAALGIAFAAASLRWRPRPGGPSAPVSAPARAEVAVAPSDIIVSSKNEMKRDAAT